MRTLRHLLVAIALGLALPRLVGAQSAEPIIDVHLHAYPPDIFGPTDVTEGEIRRLTLERMDRHNIVKGVISGPLDVVARYQEAEPERFLGGPDFPRFTPFIPLDSLRQLYVSGKLQVMGEVTSQYSGMTPTDERLEPYIALAEGLDVPFGIHMGFTGSGATYTLHPDYRIANGRPLLLEPMLARHPDLRIYVMHAGWPFLEEMVAILWAYPNVYVDISAINWSIPREEFHHYLEALIDAGFGDRIMFGSDQMIWPEAIDLAIEGVESASFLSESQKRDIFYNNAARFLGIDTDEPR